MLHTNVHFWIFLKRGAAKFRRVIFLQRKEEYKKHWTMASVMETLRHVTQHFLRYVSLAKIEARRVEHLIKRVSLIHPLVNMNIIPMDALLVFCKNGWF